VTHRIQRFSPAQAAKVMGIMYAFVGLVLIPVFLLSGFFGPNGAFGIGFVLALPLIYGVCAAIAVAIGCALYNLVARWVGGIEIQLSPPGAGGL
jgi:hypothetical protein